MAPESARQLCGAIACPDLSDVRAGADQPLFGITEIEPSRSSTAYSFAAYGELPPT